LDKYNLIKIKTEQIEMKASEEEKMLSAMTKVSADDGIGKTIEVNDLYIESIKAKLQMLE
jgi:hypothetical protein